MNGLDLFNAFVRDHATLVLVALAFVEIAPVKIDPITAILKYLSRKINKEISDRISKLEEKIEELMQQLQDNKNKLDFIEAMNSRYRIIRAAGEVQNGIQLYPDHTKQLKEDKRIYKNYCKNHPDYQNGQGEFSMEVLDEYEKKLLKNIDGNVERLEA